MACIVIVAVCLAVMAFMVQPEEEFGGFNGDSVHDLTKLLTDEVPGARLGLTESGSSGVFLFEAPSESLNLSAVVRFRLVGPQVLLLQPEKSVVGRFVRFIFAYEGLCVPGTYGVDLVLLYRSQDPELMPPYFCLVSRPIAKPLATVRFQPKCARQQHWTFVGSGQAPLTATDLVAAWRGNASSLQYPFDTEDSIFGTDLVSSGFPKEVLMLGDSQMRHLHWDVSQLGQTCKDFKARGTCLEGAVFGARLTMEHITHADDLLAKMRSITPPECCLINTGHWDLGWPRLHLLPVKVYAVMVELIAQEAVSKRWSNTRVFWISSTTHPEDQKCPRTDWRSAGSMPQYNAAATDIMRRYGIPVIDIYSISSVLTELAYDYGHYRAPVGTALGRRALLFLRDYFVKQHQGNNGNRSGGS
jgi:hypothetical protein